MASESDMSLRPVALELTRRLEKRGPAAAIVLTDEEVAALGAGKIPPGNRHQRHDLGPATGRANGR